MNERFGDFRVLRVKNSDVLIRNPHASRVSGPNLNGGYRR